VAARTFNKSAKAFAFWGIAEVLSEVDRLGGVGHTQLGIAHVMFFSSLQPNNWKTVAELAEIR
jgi:hypothetical protein